MQKTTDVLAVGVAQKKKRVRKQKGLPGSTFDLHELLAQVKKQAVVVGPILGETKSVEKASWFDLTEEEEGQSLLKVLAKQMFKADHPYRTKLSTVGVFTTNSSGVLNVQIATSSVANTAEWSTINALFDEFYVHAFELMYEPFNKHGSIGVSSSGTPGAEVITATTGASYVYSVGCIAVALFSTPAYYSTSAGMINNPNARVLHTGDSWRFAWRNNVRFDLHGPTATLSSSAQGWQGWSYVSDTANLGGALQVRAINDQAMGTGSTNVINTGNYVLRYDVSFRSRA